MDRNQKFGLFLAMAIIGGIGIGLSAIPIIGPAHNSVPAMSRIIAGTVVVTIAMVWACFFTVRAHFMQDEFNRQREISAGFWGGWLGIAASAPVFAFVGIAGFAQRAGMHLPPITAFALGYVLGPVFGAVGTLGARLWMRTRDRQAVQ